MGKARLQELTAAVPRKVLSPLEAKWPLDPKIAPMVAFLRENEVSTLDSCEGGEGHLHPNPWILFEADSNEVCRVWELLYKNKLEFGACVSLLFGKNWISGSNWYGCLTWERKSDYEQILPRIARYGQKLPPEMILSELEGKSPGEVHQILRQQHTKWCQEPECKFEKSQHHPRT